METADDEDGKEGRKQRDNRQAESHSLVTNAISQKCQVGTEDAQGDRYNQENHCVVVIAGLEFSSPASLLED
jgi:hypothetical protein